MYLGKGESGAKIILVGEHAVVYGTPAIALPFNGVKTIVEIFKTEDEITIESRFHNGYLKDGSNTILGMQQLIYYLLDQFKKPKFGLHFKVTSNIEPQRGLGSSAALSVATTRALFDVFNQELSNEDLIKFSMYSEKIYHSNPSGLDIYTIVYQKPIWFVRNEGFKALNINFKGYLLIIDTKMMSQTKLAVKHVASLKIKNPQLVENIFLKINDITNQTKKYLETDEISKLASLLNLNQQLLNELGVSNDTLEKTISSAKEYGVLGAKITGGGMGGCIIGITSDLKAAKEVIKKFKKENTNVWLYPLGEL